MSERKRSNNLVKVNVQKTTEKEPVHTACGIQEKNHVETLARELGKLVGHFLAENVNQKK